ncbi:unnamed protein product [Didymodactylos carnosus]|uniref:Uncharacterized protein n=1 Tax=Didymodactylos carnosus TaxID=1234261 RepID=A0A815KRL8_9BILA|nr:unnamed protein product [Didymodactylos carnosus]CAF4293195.1 unnamed protein product [Didymodactylos carnosus]
MVARNETVNKSSSTLSEGAGALTEGGEAKVDVGTDDVEEGENGMISLERKLSENMFELEIQAKIIMKCLENFSDDNLLPVNVPKTKAMIVHSAVSPGQPEISYHGQKITKKEQIEHVFCSGLRMVYSLWEWDDVTTLILSRELTLRDYLLKYWLRFNKHLNESAEATSYQQTFSSYLSAKSPDRMCLNFIGLSFNLEPERNREYKFPLYHSET